MKNILASLLVLFVCTGCGYVTEGKETLLESGRAKAIESETDMWNVYEHEEAGLMVNYPGERDENFRIEVTAIEDLEGTMGFDLATGQLNESELAQGKYGESVDFPIGVSKKVRQVRDLNAQEFMVLGRFEICDVVMERKLYFFSNGNQVVLTVALPRDELVVAAPEYFMKDEENCLDELIWDFEKQDDFYDSLVEGNVASRIKERFDLFDQIVEGIEFTK